jgi:hypothetical protein
VQQEQDFGIGKDMNRAEVLPLFTAIITLDGTFLFTGLTVLLTDKICQLENSSPMNVKYLAPYLALFLSTIMPKDGISKKDITRVKRTTKISQLSTS